MKIPLRYNLGSLWVRRAGTLMAVLGIALTVAIFITMMSLAQGLDSIYIETGADNQMIVIRQGSLTEVNSYFNRDIYQIVRLLPGIARGSDGEPSASGELVVIINHLRLEGGPSNVIVRGLTGAGFDLRPEVRLVEGRRFQPGLREVIVSRSLSRRFADMALGDELPMARSRWKVVGVFDSGGTAYDSEVWADYGAIAQDWDRPIYSSIILKAENAAAAESIARRVKDDPRINLQAVPQKEYFAEQTSASGGIKALGYFVAFVMGIGACFAAMNMMYGAVMARLREVATLRAIGFKRRSILSSFLIESLIVGLLGGILGCLLAAPMHGISSGTANFQTFNEVLFQFRITPRILLHGLVFALLVGGVGGWLPARRASRLKLVEILRG